MTRRVVSAGVLMMVIEIPVMVIEILMMVVTETEMAVAKLPATAATDGDDGRWNRCAGTDRDE